ncbi:TonB-dependent receptor domain-containing protein [Roseateles sp.]|uniref:TonB-dependent receptor n=1 Tax=Roseateles sp. TaxID=1971397 RepID=UPI0039430DA5
MRIPSAVFQRHALATAVFFALAGAAHAQVSTATLKGQVSAKAGAELTVIAVNQATGLSYKTRAQSDGSYTLLGLPPGSYLVRVMAGSEAGSAQAVTLHVAETAALDLAAGGANTLNTVTVTGSSARQGVRDSQMGTLVSQKMLEALPQATHNFLSGADLAPGVVFQRDGNGNTSLQSGAQNFDHVNVFIDGVGQKNNILRGGLAGQDTSRGNPFPQSAIAEYRVLTQNYKAEFDQVSSAAITAVTKSGTNQLQFEAYADRTGTNWRSLTVFEQEREKNGVALPPSSKKEFGFSVGGPIKKDQVHFFFAYDGKKIDDSRQVVPRETDKLPASAGIVPTLLAAKGSHIDSFTEHLLFGKVDANLNDEQRLSFSARVRRESDHLAESADLSAPGNDKDRKNDETRLDLKHEWIRGDWLSEARAGYEDYHWNPRSAATTAFVKYKVSTANPPRLDASQDVLFTGGSPDAQDRRQKGVFISEELSYTGLRGHVIKGGAKLKSMKYELGGTSRSVDIVETLIDRVTGNPYYSGGSCTGTNISNGGANSDQCKIDRALPSADANFSNRQLGLFIQDDWAIDKQLELNLGVRWDYESNMLNNGYATPADRVAALRAADGERWGIKPPSGQTYAQSLALGGVNIDDYISTGNSRKAFKGAIAPRLGFSYDVTGDRNTVVFGGWGRSYDRTMANHALDELQKNKQSGGEIWLIRNDFKLPYADQLSVGVRQAVGDWNVEAAYSRVTARNQFIWFGGNRDPKGGWATQSPIDPLWGGPNGFGTLILGDFVGATRTDSLFLKGEKPYTTASGWTASVAYTYADAQTTHKEWDSNIFDWTYGRSTHGWNPSKLVDRHRVVGAFMIDKLPWGMQFSTKATWASGLPRRITSCAAGWDKCVYVKGDAPSYRQVDIGLAKELSLGAHHKFTLRADVLNLFKNTNYGGFDDWGGGPVGGNDPKNAVGGDNLNLGKPNSTTGDPRVVRIAVHYKF